MEEAIISANAVSKQDIFGKIKIRNDLRDMPGVSWLVVRRSNTW